MNRSKDTVTWLCVGRPESDRLTVWLLNCPKNTRPLGVISLASLDHSGNGPADVLRDWTRTPTAKTAMARARTQVARITRPEGGPGRFVVCSMRFESCPPRFNLVPART